MTARCEIPRCRDEAALSYLSHGVCSRHWNQLTNRNAPPDALRMVLGIEAEREPMESIMSKKKNEKSTETRTEPIEMSKPEVTEESVPTAKTDPPVKTPKAGKEKKAEGKTKGATKREPKENEEGLVVFAFRLTSEERDAIHKAAGPARASRFVRTIAVAASREDEAAIRTTIKEAREARQ